MTKRATKPKGQSEPFRAEYETYDRPRETSTPHHARAPSFFNGVASIKRYRVLIEEIVEPLEVYQERLRELHRNNKQPHSAHHLHTKATELGIILDPKEAGQGTPPNPPRSACVGCEFLWHGNHGTRACHHPATEGPVGTPRVVAHKPPPDWCPLRKAPK